MMTAKLQSRLFELGWIAMMHRVLGGMPAEAYALDLLMRSAGRPVTFAAIADDYSAHALANGRMPGAKGLVTHSDNAIRLRVGRMRDNLADLGLAGVIETLTGEHAYTIQPRDAERIRETIILASGFDVEAGQVAA